jgi:hypothetical protein
MACVARCDFGDCDSGGGSSSLECVRARRVSPRFDDFGGLQREGRGVWMEILYFGFACVGGYFVSGFYCAKRPLQSLLVIIRYPLRKSVFPFCEASVTVSAYGEIKAIWMVAGIG